MSLNSHIQPLTNHLRFNRCNTGRVTLGHSGYNENHSQYCIGVVDREYKTDQSLADHIPFPDKIFHQHHLGGTAHRRHETQ